MKHRNQNVILIDYFDMFIKKKLSHKKMICVKKRIKIDSKYLNIYVFHTYTYQKKKILLFFPNYSLLLYFEGLRRSFTLSFVIAHSSSTHHCCIIFLFIIIQNCFVENLIA